MEARTIVVKGAREHNLQNVSITLPRGKLICFTGVSGSGKSSFAFDTLFAEGQRRYLESLSSYARQFLGQLAKPDVDLITGLSPAISIQQKTSGWNPRSTVGTITQIHDYLRVLFARVGRQHCPKCGQPISAQTREQIVGRILELPAGTKVHLLAPVVRVQKGEYRDLFDDMLRQGYARARVDGEIIQLSSPPKLAKNIRHNIEIVVDRLSITTGARARIAEAVENALKLGEGSLIVQMIAESTPEESAANQSRDREGAVNPRGLKSTARPSDLLLSSQYACTACGISFEPPSPQMFSFNSPTGMCLTCDGLGETFDFDPDLLVTDPKKPFLGGAIEPMRMHGKVGKWRRHIFQGVAGHVGFDLKAPWGKLPEKARRALLHGLGDAHVTFEWRWSGGVWRHGDKFEGVIAELREKHKKSQASFVREYYEKFMRRAVCPTCNGARLNPQALAVRLGGWPIASAVGKSNLRGTPGGSSTSALVASPLVGGATRPEGARSLPRASAPGGSPPLLSSPLAKGGLRGVGSTAPAMNIHEVCSLPVSDAKQFFESLELNPTEQLIARDVLKEVVGRLGFLCDVGLEYLTLDRGAPTLSGGESQRIRLASQIGAGLVGVLYILDEPSIGLHPRDNQRLLDSLRRLRDMGNTVIVVEHDEQTMRVADEIVDFGPGPGVRGGEVVAHGDLQTIAKSKRSVTGKFLRGEEQIEVPKKRRPVS